MRRAVMAEPTVWRFSREDYHRLAEIGILDEKPPTELIEGRVFLMGPIGARHAAAVGRLSEIFRSPWLQAMQWVQNPIAVSDFSEPCPDFCLVRKRPYEEGHPGPADIRLVIEVAVTSYDYDRETKGPLYAAGRVREYWLIDLVHDLVEVYRDPGAEGYRDVRIVRRGDSLRPLAFPRFRVPVDELLGPPPTPA